MDTTLNWMQAKFAYFQDTAWVAEVFCVVLLTIVLYYAQKISFRYIYPKLKKSRTMWDDTFIYAVNRPLGYLIWLFGLSFAADIIGYSGKGAGVFELVDPVRNFGIIVLITWFLLRFVNEAERNLLEGRMSTSMDHTTAHAITKVIKLSVLITAALVALQTLGISVAGILAFGGIGGAAVAFSAKDLLANFFGGLIIYLDRPFSVGDWIRSPDREIEGVVENIGWRLCRIRTFDKRPLFVPNATFNSIAIENPSRMTNRRIKTFIGLRYNDAGKVAVILSDVEAMLRAHPEIDTTQTLMVNLVEFADSSLSFMVYTFTKTTNWVKFQGIQQDVFLKIIDIILSHGAECAFPTRTVHIQEPMTEKV